MKKLINMSNLHHGGAIQVGTSFIEELIQNEYSLNNITIWISTEIFDNLKSIKINIDGNNNFKIINSYGINFLFSKLQNKLNDFDTIFTLFGPLYTFKNKFHSIVGFAQPWIIYPKNDAKNKLNLLDKIKISVKNRLQSYFYRQANVLVVELPHVKMHLEKLKLLNKSKTKIVVIENCISAIYLQPKNWKPLLLPHISNNIKIGCIGRNYPHKNTTVLPAVKLILKKVFNVSVDIYVTFTEDEWIATNEEFKLNIINVKALTVAECPSFYMQMDAIIFPSLLECFSATPLEALVMNKPLFLSDKDFMHAVAADYGIYFDPNSPENIAQIIHQNLFINKQSINNSSEYAKNFSTAHNRAIKYYNLLNKNNIQ